MKSIKTLFGFLFCFLFSIFLYTGASTVHAGAVNDDYITYIDFQTYYEGYMEYAKITAYDMNHNIAWTYTTGTYPATELSMVQEIGVYGNTYLFLENGTVKALHIHTANTLWENSDYGGESGPCLIGPDGTIYLSGYYGPDFCAIDINGNTLCYMNTLDGSAFWPCSLTLNGDTLRLEFEADMEDMNSHPVFYINTKTFYYFKDTTINETPFLDISRSDWYYQNIKRISEKGIMTGLTPTTFGPVETLSRAQFAVILYRMSGSPKIKFQSSFPDVYQSDWYADAAMWASQNGIITGYAHNGCFGPADPITREQIATMLFRYAQHWGYNTSGRSIFMDYIWYDSLAVSGFARTAMEWTTWSGIISGKYDNSYLDPQGIATRAECATMILRFEDYIMHPTWDGDYLCTSIGDQKLEIPLNSAILSDLVIRHNTNYISFYSIQNLEATENFGGELATILKGTDVEEDYPGCFYTTYMNGSYYYLMMPTDVQSDPAYASQYFSMQQEIIASLNNMIFIK